MERVAVKPARCLLAVAVLLAVTACGGQPTLQPDVGAGAPAVVQDLPGLRVSVTAGAWQGRPRSLSEHVLPLLVTAQNTGLRSVTLTRADFFLLNDASRQYLPLAPAETVALLGGRRSGGGVSPSIGVEGSTGGGGTIFEAGLGISLAGPGSETRDIIPRALREGALQPGAQLSGFLYFPRPTEGYQALRVVVAPQDLPGTPRVEFDFRRVK